MAKPTIQSIAKQRLKERDMLDDSGKYRRREHVAPRDFGLPVDPHLVARDNADMAELGGKEEQAGRVFLGWDTPEEREQRNQMLVNRLANPKDDGFGHVYPDVANSEATKELVQYENDRRDRYLPRDDWRKTNPLTMDRPTLGEELRHLFSRTPK